MQVAQQVEQVLRANDATLASWLDQDHDTFHVSIVLADDDHESFSEGLGRTFMQALEQALSIFAKKSSVAA